MATATAQPNQTPAALRKAVKTTTEELRAALASHGIKLQCLGLEPITNMRGFPCPLVSLGNCNLDTDRRLVTVLRSAQP